MREPFSCLSPSKVFQSLLSLISINHFKDKKTATRFIFACRNWAASPSIRPKMQDTNISESDFHLGRLIREELNRQKRSVTWLAEQINCDRTNCYLIFEKKYIDIPLLMRISCALNRNFIDDLAEYSRSVVKFTTTV